jgi:glycosyltransferase involved in cell wall biosynthesis
MKIVRIVRSLSSSASGVASGLVDSCNCLINMSHQVVVVTLDTPSEIDTSLFCFELICIGPVLGVYGFQFSLFSRLLSIFKSSDCVIIEGIWQYHSIAAALAASHLGIPYHVFAHGMLSPWFKKTYPFKHLKKTLYWFLFESKVINNAASVLFTTQREADLARNSFYPYSPRELVVGYGVKSFDGDQQLALQNFFDTFPELEDKELFLFLGRLHPVKGIDHLILAFASIARDSPDRRLAIVGPGSSSYQKYLRELAEQLGVSSQIYWLGCLVDDLKWGAYLAAQLFCLPSHQENFGVVVAEAMSCGLPVCIAETVNISNDVASSGGAIVHNDDLCSLIRALGYWLNTSQPQKSIMSKNSREFFLSNYDIKVASDALLAAISSS